MTLLTRSLQLRSRLTVPVICLVAAGVGSLGALIGPDMPLRILYPIPVMAAAWLGYLPLAVVIGLGLPIGRAAFEVFLWHGATPLPTSLANAAVSIAMLMAFAILTGTASTALRRVSTLEGILPICSVCKRIREGQTSWQRLETYVSAHSSARFSPVMCPDCLRRVYGSPLHG